MFGKSKKQTKERLWRSLLKDRQKEIEGLGKKIAQLEGELKRANMAINNHKKILRGNPLDNVIPYNIEQFKVGEIEMDTNKVD